MLSLATTRLITHHISGGKSILESLSDRFDYGQNPAKTLDGAKLPKMDALKKERRELAERKKKLYAQYRAAQQEMREAVAVKANVDHLLDLPGGRESKAQER